MKKLEFGSILFLCFFFPIFFSIYYLIPNKWKNHWLLIGSIFFLICGRGTLIWYFLLVTAISYIGMHGLKEFSNKKILKKFIVGIIFIQCMIWFFFVRQFSTITGWIYPICYTVILLENIGSFLDCYKKKKKIPSFLNYLTYAACFSKVLIGPIISYFEVEREPQKRELSKITFTKGMFLFLKGLCFLILLVIPLGIVKENLLEIPVSILGTWYLLLVSTFQIILWFQSYSNMSAGLGMMLGFGGRQDFSYPLMLNRMNQFFQNWHSSLGAWLDQYCTMFKKKLPLLLKLFVFAIAFSLAYGIDTSFFYFFLMICFGIWIEQKIGEKKMHRIPKIVRYFIHFVWLLLSFTFLIGRNQNIMWSNLIDVVHYPILNRDVCYQWHNGGILCLIATVIVTKLGFQLSKKIEHYRWYPWIRNMTYLFLLGIVFLYLIVGSEVIPLSFQI